MNCHVVLIPQLIHSGSRSTLMPNYLGYCPVGHTVEGFNEWKERILGNKGSSWIAFIKLEMLLHYPWLD